MERPKISEQDAQINKALLKKDYPKELTPLLTYLLDEEKEMEANLSFYEKEAKFDARKIPDRDRADENLALLREFIKDFICGDYDVILQFMHDGRNFLTESITKLQKQENSLDPKNEEHIPTIEELQLNRKDLEEECIQVEHLCRILETFLNQKK